jgi:hypothetical protein
MAAPQPSQPNGAASKRHATAVIWAALAVAFAAFLFGSAADADPEKRPFYLIGGALAALVSCFNGYEARTLFQKPRQSPGSQAIRSAPHNPEHPPCESESRVP